MSKKTMSKTKKSIKSLKKKANELKSNRKKILKKEEANKIFKDESHLQKTIDSVVNGIIIINSSGTIKLLNKGAISLFGYEKNELIGKPVSIIIPELIEKDIESFFKEIKNNGIALEMSCKTKSGKIFYVELKTGGFIDYGIQYFTIITRELSLNENSKSGNKKTDEESFTFLDEIPDAVFLADPSTFLLKYINTEASKILGYENRGLSHMSLKNIYPDIDFEKIIYGTEKINNSDKFLLIKAPCLKKDGEAIYTDIKGAIIIIEGKKYIIGSFRDTTEQKKNEDFLVQSARESTAIKNKLFSILANDLRGPLSNYMAMLDFISPNIGNISNEKLIKFIGQLQESSKSTFNLLENLLIWSRSKLGRIVFDPKNYCLKKLIVESIRQLQPVAQSKSITLNIDIDDEYEVFCDKNSIMTVIKNLFSNSLKYTSDEGKIEISGESTNGFLTISIKDNGIGIPSGNMEYLFDESQNHSTEGLKGEKGTGLGLLLCKEFVKKNKGEIWVESEINLGTTFFFTLPKVNKNE